MRRAVVLFSAPTKDNPFNKKVKTSAYGSYYDIASFAEYQSLPFSIRVLLESAVRNCDEFDITSKTVEDILKWSTNSTKQIEIPFKPARVILQDLTGVPCVVDLAAMRDAVKRLGGDANRINPQIPVDLVVDHSVHVDFAGTDKSLGENEQIEMRRNGERFAFLKWGSKAFENFFTVPPGGGIVHQVNLEYLARVVFNNNGLQYPDSVVGTDSHTTMINGLGVLGWGVGGIEAEAVMLGQSMTMILPPVVGFRLTGTLPSGCTATDLVLTITQRLRKLGVVGKFVEFFGDGLKSLSLADRATISNMAPEYGATIGFFPIDDVSLEYLRMTRSDAVVQRVDAYAKEVRIFRTGDEHIQYTTVLELDLNTVEPCISGPKRPHDRINLRDVKRDFTVCMSSPSGFKGFGVADAARTKEVKCTTTKGEVVTLRHGSVIIAAITSCTNTSNPSVIVAAALLAKKAHEKGLRISTAIKVSLSPGSRVVTKYLEDAGLQKCFEALGFYTAGYGCMTCIGNSGDIDPNVSDAISKNGLVAAAVLSGNRNFEARIHPQASASYLASPPLVVAYALAGRMDIDFETEPIADGVFLRDIWPTSSEVNQVIASTVTRQAFAETYSNIADRNPMWNALQAPEGELYAWNPESTYIHNPPYFDGMERDVQPVKALTGCRVLAIFGDSITTDHISPAGNISKTSPAAAFLLSHGVKREDFNSYGSRRGNDEVMVRGTFANQRLPNRLVGEGNTGPVTKYLPTGETLSIFDAAMKYKATNTKLVIFAGKEYGSGSSRDWAAKGPNLLGVRVVIAESFERIHRSNLVGMGIVPLQFKPNESFSSLQLSGDDEFDFAFNDELQPQQAFVVSVRRGGKPLLTFETILRIDTNVEMKFFQNGGILQYVIRGKLS